MQETFDMSDGGGPTVGVGLLATGPSKWWVVVYLLISLRTMKMTYYSR